MWIACRRTRSNVAALMAPHLHTTVHGNPTANTDQTPQPACQATPIAMVISAAFRGRSGESSPPWRPSEVAPKYYTGNFRCARASARTHAPRVQGCPILLWTSVRLRNCTYMHVRAAPIPTKGDPGLWQGFGVPGCCPQHVPFQSQQMSDRVTFSCAALFLGLGFPKSMCRSWPWECSSKQNANYFLGRDGQGV
jgi:hypothetical protein